MDPLPLPTDRSCNTSVNWCIRVILVQPEGVYTYVNAVHGCSYSSTLTVCVCVRAQQNRDSFSGRRLLFVYWFLNSRVSEMFPGTFPPSMLHWCICLSLLRWWWVLCFAVPRVFWINLHLCAAIKTHQTLMVDSSPTSQCHACVCIHVGNMMPLMYRRCQLLHCRILNPHPHPNAFKD